MSRTRRKRTVDEETVRKQIEATVDEWFNTEIHGSAVSRNTEAYNHLRRAVGSLAEAYPSVGFAQGGSPDGWGPLLSSSVRLAQDGSPNG